MKRFCLLCVLSLTMCSRAFGDSSLKLPNVSGQFYDADPIRLSSVIDAFTQKATTKIPDRPIDIIISPHAGYIYSGPVAAYSFKAVQKQKIKTVVILGPSHFYPFDGISVWKEGVFQTPLGQVTVDADFAAKLFDSENGIVFEPRVFEKEHSVEVEIPFLQKTFTDFKIVPVILGQTTFEHVQEFAAKLNAAVGQRDDVLVVVSTDMSHYKEDSITRAMDALTAKTVKEMKAEELWNANVNRTMELCGFVPATAAILYARLRGISDVEVLKYGNSADVTGDKSRVVGYFSAVFYRRDLAKDLVQKDVLSNPQKRKLLDIAKKTIDQFVRTKKKLAVSEKDLLLNREDGAFVTIHKNGQLRGCIGNILGQDPLYLTIRDMAIASATQDPRFPPVSVDELKDIDVEISVLSKPVRINSVDEIHLGVHGVIVSRGRNRGVFLPQVATDTGWSKDRFLSELCSQKAGLESTCWKDPKTVIEVFTAQVFSENEMPH